jgi:pimeloyl-ACP methyl ester carboxylesterase
MRFLTIEQTFGDYTQLINNLRGDYGFSKVIAFGGSYGGMLSAWYRLKYPNVIDGAWAASAPVAYFQGSGIPIGAFDATVKKTMETFGCNSVGVINAFSALEQCSIPDLNTIFNVDKNHLIKTKNDIQSLKNYIREGFEYMAMVR